MVASCQVDALRQNAGVERNGNGTEKARSSVSWLDAVAEAAHLCSKDQRAVAAIGNWLELKPDPKFRRSDALHISSYVQTLFDDPATAERIYMAGTQRSLFKAEVLSSVRTSKSGPTQVLTQLIDAAPGDFATYVVTVDNDGTRSRPVSSANLRGDTWHLVHVLSDEAARTLWNDGLDPAIVVRLGRTPAWLAPVVGIALRDIAAQVEWPFGEAAEVQAVGAGAHVKFKNWTGDRCLVAGARLNMQLTDSGLDRLAKADEATSTYATNSGLELTQPVQDKVSSEGGTAIRLAIATEARRLGEAGTELADLLAESAKKGRKR